MDSGASYLQSQTYTFWSQRSTTALVHIESTRLSCSHAASLEKSSVSQSSTEVAP